jgi:hypothetical protein
MREKSTHGSRCFKRALLTAALASLSWALPGMAQSGNFPGQPVAALVIDPANPATLYAGATSGVYKSTNGGATWSGVKTGANVSSLALDPSATSTIYTATAKSADGGATWSNLGSTGGNPSLLVVDPNAPSTLYAAGMGGLTPPTAFKSIDSGLTWTDFSQGLAYGSVAHPNYTGFEVLAIDPHTSTLFGGGANAGGGLILRRAKSETVWKNVFNTLLDSPFVRSVAIDPVDPAVLYAAVGSLGSRVAASRGVFKSFDGGTSWNTSNASRSLRTRRPFRSIL